MKKSCVWLLGGAIIVALLTRAEVHAAAVIAGDLQTEQGDPNDWTPSTSSLIMTESPAGFFSQSVVNLTNGSPYEFKILDDLGNPPADWGDPEHTSSNIKTWGDSDGSLLITMDTNVLNVNGKPTVWVQSDAAPFQVVGSFQSEAGGAGDWNPADPLFAMTNAGGGYYTYAATISTPGSYEFKATYGAGWDHQIGPDGYSQNAGTFPFTTTAAGEVVTMFVDTVGRSIGVVVIPEPASALLAVSAIVGMVALRRRS